MTQSINTVNQDAHPHVLCMYDSRGQRLEVLARYFADGLANNELCVFVTPDSPKRVLKDFKSAGLDASKAFTQNKLRIFEMAKSYLPHGKFGANYMLQNVVNFIMDAKARGYGGVRTAGEMTWLYDNPEYIAEAESYEQQVNQLNSLSPEFTGLCLYPVHKGSNHIIDSALRTHPSYIYDGVMQPNPLATTA